MRKVLAWLAEPVAVLGIVLALAWAAHSFVSPVRVAGGSMAPALQPGDIALVALGRRPISGDIVLIRAPGREQVLHRKAIDALIAMRRKRPGAAQIRLPGGPVLAVAGVLICLVLVTQVDLSQSRILAATVVAALLNWWWVRTRKPVGEGLSSNVTR